MLMNVDLPLPLAPMIAAKPPRSTSASMPRSACTRLAEVVVLVHVLDAQNRHRRGAPGADDVFGAMELVTTSSPAFSEPFLNSVYEWSVMPRATSTGSIAPSPRR